MMVASDSISAFDVILPKGIPFKGQVLNQIAAKFLHATADIVPNWLLATPDPVVAVGKRAEPFKVEMVIRGYLTGHAARTYASGLRTLCGVTLPEGMRENEKFPEPIITPTTKAAVGHDEDISREDILAKGIVSEEDYVQLEKYTHALFQRGTQMAKERGLILVDTKYEFGKDSNGKIDFGPTMQRLVKNRNFVEGTLAQMFYVGAQIMVWTYIYQYAESIGITTYDAVNYAYASLGVFLIGRWVCTALLRVFPPAKLLAGFALLAMTFTLGAIFLPGMTGLYSLVGISFAMSLMFPTIYGIALEGLGEDSKFAAAFLVMAIVGGAIMPTLQGMILDFGGTGYTDVIILGVPEVNFSFALPLVCFLMVWLFAVRVKKLGS